MQAITAQEFMETVFPAHCLLPEEMPVIAYPDSFHDRVHDRNVDYYRQMPYSPRALKRCEGEATYFCVSTVVKQRSRQVKKRLVDCRSAFVLVVDDIGTKSTPPGGFAPSYVLETSAGNYQWGWLLEPYDVTPAPYIRNGKSAAFYDSVLLSLAEAGHNDPGFRSASRLARLPGSRHKSGFTARIVAWNPDREYPLPALFESFDVPRAESKPRCGEWLRPGRYERLEDVRDYIYDWLVSIGRVHGHNREWVHIMCPWRDEHTDGAQGPSSTSYSPLDYGYAGRGFKCQHAHCVNRTTRDFIEWAHSNGAFRNAGAYLEGS